MVWAGICMAEMNGGPMFSKDNVPEVALFESEEDAREWAEVTGRWCGHEHVVARSFRPNMVAMRDMDRL